MFYAVYPEFSSSRADECPNTPVYTAFVILTIKLVRIIDQNKQILAKKHFRF